jgi:hypothetical protein
LPWHLPDDLKRFKALTLGKPVLMGRKTAESLGRALPKRRNLVLTRTGMVPFDGMEAVASVDEALALIAADGAEALCVIGGGELYALTLPMATRSASDPCRYGCRWLRCVFSGVRCRAVARGRARGACGRRPARVRLRVRGLRAGLIEWRARAGGNDPVIS